MNRLFRALKIVLLLCISTVVFVNSEYIEAMLIFSGLCGVFVKRLHVVIMLSYISGIITSAFGGGIFLANILVNVYFSLILFSLRISNPCFSGVIFFFVLILMGMITEIEGLYIILNALIFGCLHYLNIKISSLRQNRIF